MQLLVRPEGASAPQAELCRLLVARLGVVYAPTHVILDSNDYTNESSVLDEFRDIAFLWTPDRPRDRVPPYMLEVMNESSCTHLVWLSRKALAYIDPLFIWVLAHELRHVYQSRHAFPRECIQGKVRELRRKPEFNSLPASLFAPEEIDSELCGLRSATAMYGVARLQDIRLPRYPYPAYVRLLQEVEVTCPA